jgi:hypothetical protein
MKMLIFIFLSLGVLGAPPAKSPKLTTSLKVTGDAPSTSTAPLPPLPEAPKLPTKETSAPPKQEVKPRPESDRTNSDRTNIDTNLLKDILPDSYLLAPITAKGRNPYRRTQRSFIDVKKPMDRPLSEQEKFPLDEIKIMGYVSKSGVPTLMVKLPSDKTVFLKVGDRIGAEQGKILSITGKKVTIEESTNSSDTKGGKKIREIPLED